VVWYLSRCEMKAWVSLRALRSGNFSRAVAPHSHTLRRTAIGRGFIAFLSAMAEDERERITKRANGGREAAKARGVKFGRKAKLTPHQVEIARQRMQAGESARSIAKEWGLAHTTVARSV
jgi:DNA invertase Pin-like site-specific DNA recombinase